MSNYFLRIINSNKYNKLHLINTRGKTIEKRQKFATKLTASKLKININN